MLPSPAINYLEVVVYNQLDDADKPYRSLPPYKGEDDADSV